MERVTSHSVNYVLDRRLVLWKSGPVSLSAPAAIILSRNALRRISDSARHGAAPQSRMRVTVRATKCATGERCWETDWFPLRATAFCSALVLRRFWAWFELQSDIARAHSAKTGDNRASIPNWRELRASSCLRSQLQAGPPPAPAVPKRRSTAAVQNAGATKDAL